MPYYMVPAVLSIHAKDQEEAEAIADTLHDSNPKEGVVLLVEDPVSFVANEDVES